MTYEHAVLLRAREKAIKALSAEELEGLLEYFWLMGERAMQYRHGSRERKKFATESGIPMEFEEGFKRFLKNKYN